MSSHYLHTLREGDRLNVFVDSAARFHLQEDGIKPMIFVSVAEQASWITGRESEAR